MEVSQVLEQTIFRYFSTYIIPGIWSLFPLMVLLRRKMVHYGVKLESTIIDNIVIFAAIIAAGFIIEDIGSRVEMSNDKKLAKKEGDYYDKWYAYLLKGCPDDAPVKDYIKSLVLRLKFETNFAIAIIANLAFSIVLCIHGDFKHQVVGYFVPYLALSLLAMVYLFSESHSTTRLLANIRNKLIASNSVGNN